MKLKKFKKSMVKGKALVIYEKINNDPSGNPRHQADFFYYEKEDKLTYQGSYNYTNYDIEGLLEEKLDELNKNMEENYGITWES